MEVRPGYKLTEVGVIPAEWEVTNLGDCLASGPDYGINASAVIYSDKLPTYIRITDITADGQFSPENLVSVQSSDAAKFYLRDGDIVIARTGASVGKSYLYNVRDGPLVFAGFLIRIRPDPRKLLPEFAVTYLMTGYYWNWVQHMSMRSGQPGINGNEYTQLPIPLPTVPEQRAIVGALRDVDALMDALTRLVAKKHDLKQSAMQQLLTGRHRLPGFSGEWITLSMVEKSTLKARIGWQGLTTAEYLPTGNYFLVTGTDLENGRVNWASCCFVESKRYVQDKNIQLRIRDILLTKDGTIGKVGFVDFLPGPATLNSGVFVIRPKGNGHDPLFLYYILTSRVFEEFLAQLQAGSTISHLYQKDFVNFSFRVPLLPEQTAIAALLSDMDVEIAALEARLVKIRSLKQGMMQELLTGRIRLI